MIIDRLENAAQYLSVHTRIGEAFHYLQTTDLLTIPPGKYAIDSNDVFAIVQEYETINADSEQMESHKKYIDVQYMISGSELVGHALFHKQSPSKPYDPENDFMLFADKPSFFSALDAGTFMVFFPTDLHMPCIMAGNPTMVKKVVVKVRA